MDKTEAKRNQENSITFEFDEKSEVLTIHEFRIKNKEVVEYLRSYPVEEQEKVMDDILGFGVKALKSFLTENFGKTIDAHFQNGFSDLDNILTKKIAEIDRDIFQAFLERAREKVVDDFSKKFEEKKESLMTMMRDNSLKLDKEVLQSFIDDLKDKVFATFKTDFGKISEDLKSSLKEYVVEKEISKKTPLKGSEFENYIVQLSELMSKPYGDEIDHVGPDNLTGDILVRNNSEGLKFSIEVKDRTLTSPLIKDTFEDMEKIRKVQYSIIVFRSSDQVPKNLGSFHLYGRNRMIVAIASKTEDPPNSFLFEIGYRIIRSLMLSEKPQSKEIDISLISKHIKSVEITLKTVGSIKGKITSFSSDLTNDLDELKRGVEDETKAIEDILKV